MIGRACVRDREHDTRTFEQDRGSGHDVDRPKVMVQLVVRNIGVEVDGSLNDEREMP
jgi:hypothetical protein